MQQWSITTRAVSCLVMFIVLCHLAQAVQPASPKWPHVRGLTRLSPSIRAPGDTLTATWTGGKAESTKGAGLGGLTTVDDTVTNSHKTDQIQFWWYAESGGTFNDWALPGKSASQTWNTTGKVVASKKGEIDINWYVPAQGGGWTYDRATSYTAQKWIPDGGGCDVAEPTAFSPSDAAVAKLFGEQASDGNTTLRVESTLVDITGFGHYVITLSVANGSLYDITLIDPEGNKATVSAGRSSAIPLALATSEDLLEEVPRVYGLIVDLGNGRQITTSLRAHYWRLRNSCHNRPEMPRWSPAFRRRRPAKAGTPTRHSSTVAPLGNSAREPSFGLSAH